MRGFILRVVEMNYYLTFLPCLKDLEGSPQGIKRTDVRLDQFKMCTLILNAILFPLSSAYWAKQNGEHFPMDVDVLAVELVHLEPEFGRAQHLYEQAK